jgi:sigma-B regulation protein RsbU (phosphoserine phosphatase)
MKGLREHITYKSILVIVVLMLIFAVVIGLIGYQGFTSALLEQHADGAFLTARTAAHIVDANRIDEYLQSGGETEEYQAAYDTMDRLCNTSGSTFIYVILPDRSDYNHITFLFSTENRDRHYSLYDFGYVRETTNDDYREKYRAICEEGSDREVVIRDKGYIETDPHITMMIPLTASDGEVTAILCVQRQMDSMAAARNSFLHKVLITLAVLVLVVIVGETLYLNRALLHPVRTIVAETSRFASEGVTAEKKLQDTISNRDEIGLLAESIDHMEEQIQTYVKDLTAITAEKERISTELSLAARIQASMLPCEFPPFPDRTEFDLYASMDPAREVGGDFYDFFFIDDDHLCLVIADVSGKGIPGALFMMISKIILQSCAMLGKSAGEILTKTNEAICSNNKEDMFVTVWVGILEVSTGRMIASNAGHEYPAVKRADGQYELLKDKHGFVIGGMDGLQYKEYELILNPGDKIFVYTDGVPEATDADKRLFGTSRMIEALNRDPDASPKETLENVQAAIDDFVKDEEQFDDVTMLCFEYKGPAA